MTMGGARCPFLTQSITKLQRWVHEIKVHVGLVNSFMSTTGWDGRDIDN